MHNIKSPGGMSDLFLRDILGGKKFLRPYRKSFVFFRRGLNTRRKSGRKMFCL